MPQLPQQLTTNRTFLKSLTIEDAPAIFALRSNAEVMRYMDTEWCSTIADAEMFISRLNESDKENKIANWGIFLKDSINAIGFAGFWKIDAKHFRGEIAYALEPYYWRTGIMLEALNCIVRIGFKELGLHSIQANINPKNTASEGLLLKLGFTREAHFTENFYYDGVFHDSYIYCLLEKDLKGNPELKH